MDEKQSSSAGTMQAVEVPFEGTRLRGDLVIPEQATGIVIFAHGSGSGRHSPRNRFVAQVLQQAGLATLLLDLLTRAEEAREAAGAMLRFDIDLLAERLLAATEWVRATRATQRLSVGYFGASTGAAAALTAAATRPDGVFAVVSRGGRPDLTSAELLARVEAPTLLIVGGDDVQVLAFNRRASTHLRCEHELEVIAGATHLFEEPGALENVSVRARDWFVRHLRTARAEIASEKGHEPRAW